MRWTIRSSTLKKEDTMGEEKYPGRSGCGILFGAILALLLVLALMSNFVSDMAGEVALMAPDQLLKLVGLLF